MEIQEFFDGIVEKFGEENCFWQGVGQIFNDMRVVDEDLYSYVFRYEGEDDNPMTVELQSGNKKTGEVQPSPRLMKYINQVFGSPICSFHYLSEIFFDGKGELLVFVWGRDRKAVADWYTRTALENPDRVHDLEITV